MESFILDWLLPVITPYLDSKQFGGVKGLSTVHYLIRFLDFTHKNLDHREPHAVMSALIDLSKAFNRIDHNLVIEDLYNMKCPAWLLRLVISYLSRRSLIVEYNGASTLPKALPGGSPQGTLLGGIIFIVKFNGAFLRPSIPRPNLPAFNDSSLYHTKYFDDASVLCSINLKKLLQNEVKDRPRPFTFNESSGLFLPSGHNLLQYNLQEFSEFAAINKLKVNHEKTKILPFNFSHKYRFPPELTISSSETIECVTSAKILGLIISSDLKWKEHIEYW